MQKALCALAVASGVALAGEATAQNYLEVESFGGLTTTSSPGGNVVNPVPGHTLPGAPDIDAAGEYNSSYEYGGPYLTVLTSDSFPKTVVANTKSVAINGDTDQFFRVFNSTAITNTTPNLNFAFAFKITSRSATAADNTLDLWRLLDIGRTGSGSGLAAVTVRSGDIVLQNNGLGAAPANGVIGNISQLTDNVWYLFVVNFKRAASPNGAVDCYAINTTSGALVTFTSLTGLGNTNTNEVATLSTGATLVAPTGGASFNVILDDVAIYPTTLNDAALISAIRTDFNVPAPSSVIDWTMY